MNTTDTAALIAEIHALPKLPTVVAKSAIHSQGVKWSDTDRTTFAAHKAFNVKHGFPTRLTVPVVDFDGVRVGELVIL